MTQEQKKGRLLLMVFIGIMAFVDVAAKVGLLFYGSSLGFTKVVGTLILACTLYYLWRGSKFAFGFLVFGGVMSGIFSISLFFNPVPLAFPVGMLAFMLVLGYLLFAPSTRRFLEFQRNIYAK